MNRRQALSLLAAAPLAASRIWAQTRPTAQFRVFMGSGNHRLLLEPGGTLQAWLISDPRNGLAPDWLGLGDSRPIEADTLVQIPGLTNVMAACAGSACSFAVLGDGRLLSWGDNSGMGTLGTTPLSQVEVTASWGPSSNKPVPVATKFDAVAVSSLQEHVLALARDGGVYAWGRGLSGELGIGPMPVINFKTHTPGPMSFVPFPVRIPDLSDVTAISAGARFSMALLKNGTVRVWGDNALGTIGDGSMTNRPRPIPVEGVRDAVAIAAGGTFALVLLADGTVVTWGATDESGKVTPKPVSVPGVRGIRAIAAGNSHAVGLTGEGTVVTWGSNLVHELGRGRNIPLPPGPVPGLNGVVSIAAGGTTTTAVLSSGRIMTWGSVRFWPSPDTGGAYAGHPILLWVDGLDQS
jgi:alpha-tubulin suppressor-like RCC1 family protein